MAIFIMHKTHIINSITSFGFEIHAIDHLKYVWQNSLLNILFAMILWVVLTNGSYLLSLKPIVSIGQISYGIYVFHFPIMGIVNKVATAYKVPLLSELFASFSIIILLAWCSYNLFEKRFLAMKDKITSSPPKKP
jgi:peptidoglycan/LPS O-acetylase OafA/YrhL